MKFVTLTLASVLVLGLTITYQNVVITQQRVEIRAEYDAYVAAQQAYQQEKARCLTEIQ